MEDFSLERGWIFKLILALFLVGSHTCTYADESPQRVQQKVAPYLLPDDHFIKPTLDAIFGNMRATLNLKTLVKAGFNKTHPRQFTGLIITKHPGVPGFVFKLYLDAQRYHKEQPEYYYWILRIQGVQRIEEVIAAYGLESLFKCPKKWIYALPKDPKPPEGYLDKSYILVEEDMDLMSSKANGKRWRSNAVTHEMLDQLFLIIHEAGLADSTKPDNIPFSTDGRIAFIDTEIHGKKKIDYSNLLPYLSNKNQAHWNSLIELYK